MAASRAESAHQIHYKIKLLNRRKQDTTGAYSHRDGRGKRSAYSHQLDEPTLHPLRRPVLSQHHHTFPPSLELLEQPVQLSQLPARIDTGLEALFEAGVVVADGETGQVRMVTALQSDRNYLWEDRPSMDDCSTAERQKHTGIV
jgi:hypothetical protein